MLLKEELAINPKKLHRRPYLRKTHFHNSIMGHFPRRKAKTRLFLWGYDYWTRRDLIKLDREAHSLLFIAESSVAYCNHQDGSCPSSLEGHIVAIYTTIFTKFVNFLIHQSFGQLFSIVFGEKTLKFCLQQLICLSLQTRQYIKRLTPPEVTIQNKYLFNSANTSREQQD